MTKNKNENDGMTEYELGGHTVTVYPAEKIKRRHFESASPVRLVTPQISPWEEERLSKSERLLYKLSIAGSNPLAVHGTSTNKISSYDVWAALACIRTAPFKNHPTWGSYEHRKLWMLIVELQIYKISLDQASHREVFVSLLYELIDRSKRERWIVKKPKILENMALTVIEQICNPHEFRDTRSHDSYEDSRFYTDHRALDGLSYSQWAGRLGLGDRKDWPKRWKPRYFEFLNDVTALDIYAADEMAGQF